MMENTAFTTLEDLGLNRSEVLEKIQEKQANQKWLQEHMDELRREYPDKYVAVSDGKVALSEKHLTKLIQKLNKKFKEKDLTTFAIDLVTKEKVIWVL